MGRMVPLGQTTAYSIVARTTDTPQIVEDRIAILENRLNAMTLAFYETRAALAEKERSQNAYSIFPHKFNRDGIPMNTSYIGMVNETAHILTVSTDGNYYIGNIQYPSLSAAAAAVGAPERKSGWRFWKTADGTSLKQLFRS
jgi:hypothetical protein